MVTVDHKESTDMPIDEEDLEKLAALFHIHKQAMGHPKLKALGDEAMKHLEEYSKGLEPQPEEAQPIEDTSDQGQEIGEDSPEDDAEHTDTTSVTRR